MKVVYRSYQVGDISVNDFLFSLEYKYKVNKEIHVANGHSVSFPPTAKKIWRLTLSLNGFKTKQKTLSLDLKNHNFQNFTVVSPYLSILAHSIHSCTSGRYEAKSTTNTNPVPTSWSSTVYTSSIVNIVRSGCTPDYAIWSTLDLIQTTRNVTPCGTWQK